MVYGCGSKRHTISSLTISKVHTVQRMVANTREFACSEPAYSIERSLCLHDSLQLMLILSKHSSFLRCYRSVFLFIRFYYASCCLPCRLQFFVMLVLIFFLNFVLQFLLSFSISASLFFFHFPPTRYSVSYSPVIVISHSVRSSCPPSIHPSVMSLS